MSTTLTSISAAIATGTASAAVSSPTTSNRALPQGGILEGASPVKYDSSNPIILFIIQTSLIVIVCHALHWPLAKIRQPRVIAEVVGVIILGPSVMGRVAGFRAAIFPKESLLNLNLVANLGLVLYLFLIGLETDVRFLVHNWRVATSVAFAGLALPFGVGCALAWGIYTAFRDDSGVHPIPFTTYMLFIGIAIAITAFPVLCRILTELKLLDTSVGVITLSAGVANDIVARGSHWRHIVTPFTLSGLNTNLGLLDTGTAWGYVFATTFIALLTKIVGASVVARLNGLVWRESFTIGVLMSCKGLVELIVLNIGLQANILSTRTFTIFVVMALLTTFATTPIVSLLYPPSYQAKVEVWRRGELDWESGATFPSSETGASDQDKSASADRMGKILAYLRLDSMPVLLNLLTLLGGPDGNAGGSPQVSKAKDGLSSTERSERPVWVLGMRLLHLTDRDSSVMTVSQVAEYSRHDPVVNTFRTVGQLHNLAISGEVAIMPEARFAEALIRKATIMSSDFVLLPWSETGGICDSPILSSATLDDKMASTYGSFVKSVLVSNDHNIGVFFSQTDDTDTEGHVKPAKLNQNFPLGISADGLPVAPSPIKPYHIFMAYFGGEDDALALDIVLQLCERSKASATIVRASASATHASSLGTAPDLFALAQSRLAADAAARVEFSTVPGVTTADDLLQLLVPETRPLTSEVKAPILAVLGRGSGADMAPGKACKNVREDVVSCLGTVAGYLLAGGVKADLFVVQSKRLTETSTEAS